MGWVALTTNRRGGGVERGIGRVGGLCELIDDVSEDGFGGVVQQGLEGR